MAFNSTFSGMVNEEYYLTVALFELLSFQFIRTRSSIKYFPKFITILNMVFLMYVTAHMYPAQQEAMQLLFSA